MRRDDGLKTEKNDDTFIKPISLSELVRRDERIRSNFCQIFFLIKRSGGVLATSQILSNLSPPPLRVKNTLQAQRASN